MDFSNLLSLWLYSEKVEFSRTLHLYTYTYIHRGAYALVMCAQMFRLHTEIIESTQKVIARNIL